MATRVMKVRLAELQRLMQVVEGLVSQDESRQTHSSTNAAGLLFTKIKHCLPFSTTSTIGRERRLSIFPGSLSHVNEIINRTQAVDATADMP
ncbi:hypothetical protein JG687_00010714 [Phytophthora cactorum]|uniref:Uncharacterized protein n=1 Tax=Phytophthora cactorum TaxID=29920 RepID=A0A8T1U7Q8_9STRA|nr:hypothetical protein JG687_00010714 [Phytophthora cactorum]